MSVTAFIALGSNLGDRQAYLDQALHALSERPGILVGKVSSYHETEPVGGPRGQGKYLNAAAELQTELAPRELLQVLLQVEQTLGRVRSERDGPRTVDLDLLLYADLVREEPELIVPHPRMHERLFVLEPLAEIAAETVHPLLGRSIRFLLEKRQLQEERAPISQLRLNDADVPAKEKRTRQMKEFSGRELLGQQALITGSTSGIGRAIALELAAAGADVILHGRHLARAEAVAQQVQTLDVRTRNILADLHEPEECRRLVRTAWAEGPPLDIWINNAGADTLTREAAQWPFERKLQELWTIDVQATMLLSREVGQRMKERGSGVILNMGWDQAETGMEGDSGQLFAATKGAVMAFTKSLALTLAPQVRVNCLAPGWIRTAWGENASERWQDRVRRETPLRRWGTPEDVATVARWLVSPAAAFITGQVIRIDGGAVR